MDEKRDCNRHVCANRYNYHLDQLLKWCTHGFEQKSEEIGHSQSGAGNMLRSLDLVSDAGRAP